MNAALLVGLAWLVFAGSHLALGLPPLRPRLAQRLGEQRFVAVFSAVAALSLALLAVVVARVGGDGPPGFPLASIAWARWTLAGVALLGLTLAMAGLLNYMRSPMALFRTHIRAPAGVERITRHPFFAGLTLFACAHALLAPTRAIAMYFAGFAVLATGGALVQDRKLIGKYGAAYADYVAQTSFVPFVALLTGRQAFAQGERVIGRLGASFALALLVLAAHPWLSAYHGAPFAGAIALGGLYASARRFAYSRTQAA